MATRGRRSEGRGALKLRIASFASNSERLSSVRCTYCTRGDFVSVSLNETGKFSLVIAKNAGLTERHIQEYSRFTAADYDTPYPSFRCGIALRGSENPMRVFNHYQVACLRAPSLLQTSPSYIKRPPEAL
ncbi:hypothetical protein EVAR_44589_1 [Eumeta japonica]|uniref:Uncharacterized protein n=1 Tax=Eumeta variegata TaxID=151549 RepID=A0A4C1X9T3_EUMVA|nr:hypothetical protein EVAR_44589_1 [Eumeta japonica]